MNLVRLRFFAVAIDLLLVAAVAILVKNLLLLFLPTTGGFHRFAWDWLSFKSWGYIGFSVLVYGICGGILRASPGKRLLKLRVSATDGVPPGFFRIMLRENVRMMEIVFFVSGFFSLLNLLESRPTTTDALLHTCVRDTRR